MTKRMLPSIVGVMVLAACTATGGSPSATTSVAQSASAAASSSAAASADAGTVGVTLQEFAIVTDSSTVPAGSVTFHVTNTGPKEVHEMVVIRTDLAPDKLPVGPDGAVEEEADGLTVMGEVEDLAVGDSKDLTLDLQAGSYVLICNVNENNQAHYMLGMRTGLTAE